MVFVEDVKNGGYERADEFFVMPEEYCTKATIKFHKGSGASRSKSGRCHSRSNSAVHQQIYAAQQLHHSCHEVQPIWNDPVVKKAQRGPAASQY